MSDLPKTMRMCSNSCRYRLQPIPRGIYVIMPEMIPLLSAVLHNLVGYIMKNTSYFLPNLTVLTIASRLFSTGCT